MPTPHGSRGGMAFSADELRVLRRALAVALHPVPVPAEDVQKCLRLADALDEATREADRLRGFVLADLARYREALPGTASGYFALLRDALAAGYVPGPDDLAALRALRADPVAAALLAECRTLAERSVRARLSAASAAPSPRARLLAFPTARAAKGEPPGPVRKPEPKDPEPVRPDEPAKPARPAPAGPGERPRRPVPTPGEVFPPRRRPAPPPQHRAAG